ncbi:MAG: hypothetical protein ACE37F_08505 [Nannocystaceae bacterium]|nr:hypothetical protein [bacterium]
MKLSVSVLYALLASQPDADEATAAQPDASSAATDGDAATDVASPTEDPPAAEPEVRTPAAESSPAVSPEPEPEPEPILDSERYTVAGGPDGPPFYDDADTASLRARHEIEVEPLERTEGPRWRCLIADPACGRSVEVNALAAYSFRGRQGDVSGGGNDPRWHSGRAQYDVWLNFPVMTEVVGNKKFTRMTLAPKGGLIASDGGSTWGNLGMAFRYWLGRGRWAPAVEFTSALSFKLGENARGMDNERGDWTMTRGPVGFTADVGFGLGGFGSIVVGGQYDSPFAREEISDEYRTAAGGAFFIGFRGNILWGGPAAAAVATHAVTQRSVQTP